MKIENLVRKISAVFLHDTKDREQKRAFSHNSIFKKYKMTQHNHKYEEQFLLCFEKSNISNISHVWKTRLN